MAQQLNDSALRKEDPITITTSHGRKPFVLGQVREFYSTILGEKRNLNIYLPEGYGQNDSTRFPVIYLLDGSADEDFIHVAGLVQYFNFPWINQLPPCILVGICNVDRQRDFTSTPTYQEEKEKFPHAGGSAAFIEFLEKELKPFVQESYKTTSQATLIGQSLGGLLATEILLKQPHLFNRFIIISPSLWWNNRALLQHEFTTEQQETLTTRQVYIAVGNEGPGVMFGNTKMETDAKNLLQKIKRAAPQNKNFTLDYFPDETHATIGHPAVFKGFRYLQSRH
ncbi:putative esterase [Flavihumibacter petaseus NBRC 106054]|uniref:Putative esterase n=2 Tax=Flavihumibacter TaxID=1004301 RepID=A0A0E9N248_9BACT|nr:putative esterase [Flavihumibacter petaseus NBRC 106054]